MFPQNTVHSFADNKMKTTIVLLLCGIAYCSASPRCSKEVFEECNPNPPDVEELEETVPVKRLNSMCKYTINTVKCQVDFLERCPNIISEERKDVITERYRIFSPFCEKLNPLRMKFLENSVCLQRSNKEIFTICGLGDKKVFDSGYCKVLKRQLDCSKQVVEKVCGEDALELYVHVLNPEYQLRKANCL